MRLFCLILIAALTTGFTPPGDLASAFRALEHNSKGPFSLNYLQGTQGRKPVNGSGSTGSFQFQAAFRNDDARVLSAGFDFYVANLFTTNYYELMGEYVFGDAYGSHAIDEGALLAKNAEAMPKASSMARHWVLEKHYLEHFSDSALARGFKLRGISGTEFEQKYAVYFFNFYLSSLSNDFQYLPAFLLIGQSPVGESASLAKARDLVAQSYDYFNARWGTNDRRVKRLYQLRNLIHNQLSEQVIAEIDRYVEDFPFYREEGHTYLFEVQKIVRAYYSASAKAVAEKAGRLGLSDLKAAAANVVENGSTPESLLALSEAAAALKSQIGNASVVPYDKKTDALLVISRAAQFLNKEVNSMQSVTSPVVLQVILNTIYMEGFLIQDNWQYFKGEIAAQADLKQAASQLTDVIDISTDTLTQAFAPALAQWISVEPGMQYFMDNTIKSSALNTASITVDKIK